MSIYRETLGQAWSMTWRHKFLWIFGLFAALLGTGGAWETFFRNLSMVSEQPKTLKDLQLLEQSGTFKLIIDNVTLFFATPTADKFLTLLLVTVIFLAVFCLMFLAVAAIIYAIGRIHEGNRVGVTEALGKSFHFFLPAFALNLLGKVVVWGLLLATGVPLVSLFLRNQAEVWNVLTGVVAFLVLVPVGVVVTFLVQYATAYVILRGKHIGEAIREAWKLFATNWLASIEMAFILYLINVVVGYFLFVLFLAPLQQLVLSYLGGTFAALVPLLQLSIFFTFLVLAGLSAILATFEFSAYTIFFLKLTEGKVVSKLVRIFSRFTSPSTEPAKRTVK